MRCTCHTTFAGFTTGPPPIAGRASLLQSFTHDVASCGCPQDTDMPRYLHLLLALCLWLPFAAQASDAGDFVAAQSSERAQLLETWAARPDPARVELLIALQDGRVAADSSNRAFIQN